MEGSANWDKCTGDFCSNPGKNHSKRPMKGRGGYKDKDGNYWTSDKSGHRGPHWDVTKPDGSHENVDKTGKVLSVVKKIAEGGAAVGGGLALGGLLADLAPILIVGL